MRGRVFLEIENVGGVNSDEVGTNSNFQTTIVAQASQRIQADTSPNPLQACLWPNSSLSLSLSHCALVELFLYCLHSQLIHHW